MGYQVPLFEARCWLTANKRDDGGWGLAPGQGASLVNTAEALFVLRKANATVEDCLSGLQYLATNVEVHVKDSKRGPRSRYASFPLMVLRQCFPDYDPSVSDQIGELLFAGRNSDDGWGWDLRDERSDIFSTYLAVEALRSDPAYASALAAAGRWVISKASAAGWSFHDRQEYSTVATALAIQILHHSGLSDSPAFTVGRELLLTTKVWDEEDVVIWGTPWVHCRAAAVLKALVLTGTEPFHPTIADGIRVFNKRMISGFGWGEKESSNLPTVRSQYWAVSGLSAVQENFDASIHIPRVSAERLQGTLVEPQFLPFLVGSAWQFIVPAVAFRWSVYLLIIVAALLSSGLIELLVLPTVTASVISLALLAWAAFLVRK